MRVALGVAVGSMVVLAGCGGVAQLPVSAGMGPDPTLPPPERSPSPP